MSVLTPRQLRHLASSCGASRQSIVQRIIDNGVDTPRSVVWGQFLDAARGDRQYGIYGTGAAAAILARNGYGRNTALVGGAEQSIRAWGERRSSPFDQSDLRLTYKVAAACEAIDSDIPLADSLQPLEKHLLELVVPGSDAWGSFHGETTASLLPTATALYALRRSRHFIASREATSAVAWLARHVLEGYSGLPLEQLAMAVLALEPHRLPDRPGEAQRLEAIGKGSQAISELVQGRRISELGTKTTIHYPVDGDNKTHNHYVYCLPDVLAASALLLTEGAPSSRKYVLQVARHVVENVSAHGAYQAEGRIATRDQNEVDRFLELVTKRLAQGRGDLLPAPLAFVDASLPRRLITGLVLASGGAWGTYVSVAAQSSAEKTVGGVLAMVLLGILAAALWGWGVRK